MPSPRPSTWCSAAPPNPYLEHCRPVQAQPIDRVITGPSFVSQPHKAVRAVLVGFQHPQVAGGGQVIELIQPGRRHGGALYCPASVCSTVVVSWSTVGDSPSEVAGPIGVPGPAPTIFLPIVPSIAWRCDSLGWVHDAPDRRATGRRPAPATNRPRANHARRGRAAQRDVRGGGSGDEIGPEARHRLRQPAVVVAGTPGRGPADEGGADGVHRVEVMGDHKVRQQGVRGRAARTAPAQDPHPVATSVGANLSAMAAVRPQNPATARASRTRSWYRPSRRGVPGDARWERSTSHLAGIAVLLLCALRSWRTARGCPRASAPL